MTVLTNMTLMHVSMVFRKPTEEPAVPTANVSTTDCVAYRAFPEAIRITNEDEYEVIPN